MQGICPELRYPEEYVKAIEILKDFFFLERGYLNANHFAYRSREPILIDTAYIGDFSHTADRLSAVGIEMDRIGLIITTHCHCDHVGGNRILQEQSGCDIALHPLGKHYMDTRDDWSTWWRFYHQEADFFKATRTLEDGEIVPIGPHEFEIIHTPGHSADGIALFNKKEKMLLSSDALWEKDMAVMTLRVEGRGALPAVLSSLERIASLGAQRVYPGHGPPFTRVNEAISRSTERVRRFLKNEADIGNDLLKKITVYTLLMQRGAPEDTFYPRLMQTAWFKDTVDFYFSGQYRIKYDEIIKGLLEKKVLLRKAGNLYATVKP